MTGVQTCALPIYEITPSVCAADVVNTAAEERDVITIINDRMIEIGFVNTDLFFVISIHLIL